MADAALPIRKPRSLKEATALLERYAMLDGQIAAIEAERQDAIAAVNARADTAGNALIARRDAIAAKVEPWWAENRAELIKGKRKSIELGGCMIGSRAGRAKLGIAGEEGDLVAALKERRWAKTLLKVSTSLDKVALLKAVNGPRGPALKELGVSRAEGVETFYVERVVQDGTLASAGAGR